MGAIRDKSGQDRRKGKQSQSNSIPSVQRIKSAIRQTTRLLSKEKLDARVRVESERRLKVLQEDLEKTQLKRKERTIAARYQKIRHIEKTKTIHRISNTKRKLKDATLDAKARSQLEGTLFERRVDLNYTIHFPGLKKYVSLYKSNEDINEGTSSTSVTDTTRQEVRSWVSKCMKSGELPAEPEVVLNRGTTVKTQQHPTDDEDEEEHDSNDEDVLTSKERTTKQPIFESKLVRTSKRKQTSASNLTLAGDDFFGEDD